MRGAISVKIRLIKKHVIDIKQNPLDLDEKLVQIDKV